MRSSLIASRRQLHAERQRRRPVFAPPRRPPARCSLTPLSLHPQPAPARLRRTYPSVHDHPAVMDPPPEGHLRLVPCDPHAPFLARALLPELQHAVRHQRGLLLLHLPADVVQSSRLAALRERRGGATFAAVGSAPNPSAFFVAPDSAAEAAAALHALGSELTKAHMLRMGRRSTALEPFLDPLQDWLQPGPGSDERVHCRCWVLQGRT